ncbi:MAG TPA: FlhC family transcriptional regulator [Povalibacter sp.]|uniref:FlhC family transcriptional regulator n=1 Tax=Povalibacter sp. TaxID=1962978 RepID=UPI002B94890B|nr:FlhC family transcriptional regulator [Povalibacter sp.]HMN43576.1 FlhC family transcriptional regulator [Povalibacter sp.]
MQISNDCYFLDRQRHDLALRMIRHEARTCTIRTCTGLTDDRIRRLYKTFTHHEAHIEVRRHRGKSPRQASYFTRSTRMQFEASCLGNVFAAFDLLQTTSGADELEYGERFCDAYETHRQLVQGPRISFEHAWFLLNLLSRGATLHANRCRHCSSRYLRDRFSATRRRCPFCELKAYEPMCIGRPARRSPARKSRRTAANAHRRVTASA